MNYTTSDSMYSTILDDENFSRMVTAGSVTGAPAAPPLQAGAPARMAAACCPAGSYSVGVGDVYHPVANVLARADVPPTMSNHVQEIIMTISKQVTAGEFLQRGSIKIPMFRPENTPRVDRLVPTIDYCVQDASEQIGHKQLGPECLSRILSINTKSAIATTPFPIMVNYPGVQRNAHCEHGVCSMVLPGHGIRVQDEHCMPCKIQAFDRAHEARAHALCALHESDLTNNTVVDPDTGAVTLLTPNQRGHPLVEFSWVTAAERATMPNLEPCYGYNGALSAEEYKVRLEHARMTRAASYAIPADVDSPANQIEFSIGDVAHAKTICEAMLRAPVANPLDVKYMVHLNIVCTVVYPGANGVVRRLCNGARGEGAADF